MRNRLAWSAEWRAVVAETLESLGVAAWEWDVATGGLWWSDNLGPLVGKPRGFTPVGFAEALAMFAAEAERPASEQAVLDFVSARGEPIEVERRALLPDGSTRWLLNRYSPVRDEAGKVTGLFGVVIDIDDRKRGEREEEMLLQGVRRLARSLDIEETLASIAGLLVPDLADWCVVELLENGRLRTVVNAHVDPGKVRWAHAIQADHPKDMSAAIGSPNVVRTGQPEIYRDVTDEMLMEVAGGDEHLLEMLRAVGYRSVMVLPLAVRGQVLGAVTLVKAESGDRFDERSLRFAERLASQMATTLDNARLLLEADARGDMLARLHRATVLLTRAAGVDEVAEATLDAAVEVSEASATALIWAGEAGRPAIAAGRGFDLLDAAEWQRLVASNAGPLANRIGAGEPLFVTSRDELAPLLSGTVDAGDLQRWASWAFLPVKRSEGVAGALVLAFADPAVFTPRLREALAQLAEQVGLALDRAYLLAHHRGIAAALQEGLQPQRLPDIAGIRAAAVYLPAGDVDAGGDWYDLFETGDGAVMAVIGDVVGHGIPAVASMARLRHVLSGYLFAGHGPGESLRLTNQVLFGMIDEHQRMATVAIAMIDRDRRRVVTARAGHPPMIVRSGDEVHLTDVQVQPPLGVTAGTEWVPEEILDLKPDTLLVLYTDGWIDFPGSDPMGRIEAMCRVVAAAEADPDAVLAALEERFTDHRRRDDAAALAVVVL